MDISIVIVNYKTKGLVKYCLRGLKKLNLNLRHEVIVVDNGSQDEISQLIDSEFPEVIYVSSKKNKGLAYGNNLGIKKSKGRYILILNPDIVVLDNSIEKLVSYMNTNQTVGIMGPKLLNPDKSIQNSCFRYYKFFTPFYRRTFLGKFSFAQKELARFLMKDYDHREKRTVDWVLGGAMIIRKSSLEKIGLFDERFFLYFEDVDLCKRFHENGIDVIYFPEAVMIHYHMRESLGNIFSNVTRAHVKSWVKYFYKHRFAH